MSNKFDESYDIIINIIYYANIIPVKQCVSVKGTHYCRQYKILTVLGIAFRKLLYTSSTWSTNSWPQLIPFDN